MPVEDALAILQAENAALRAQLAERDAALDVANAQIEALSFQSCSSETATIRAIL